MINFATLFRSSSKNALLPVICQSLIHYSYVSTCPWFYPFGLTMALSICYLSSFRTFAFCIEISWNFACITIPLVSYEETNFGLALLWLEKLMREIPLVVAFSSYVEFRKCIIVMFQLVHDFTRLASQWLFYALPVFIQNLCILHGNQLKFYMHHCTTGILWIN